MEQQLDNLPKPQYKDSYEEYIVKHNKFNFFKKPLKPYVPESSAIKYAVIASLLVIIPTILRNTFTASMIVEVLTLISYSSSAFFAVQAYFKLKEWSFSKGLTPLSQPITLAIVSVMLAAMPSLMSYSSTVTYSSGTPQLNHPVLNKVSI